MTLVGMVVVLLASPAESSGIIPGANPETNIAPEPNFLSSGWCNQTQSGYSCTNPCITPSLSFPSFTNSSVCSSFVLRAIDRARKLEGVGPMILPSNWQELSVPEQLFVVADLERTARGLPPYLGLNAALVGEAQHAAAQGGDPSLAPGFAVGVDAQGYNGMGGAWSSGFSPLGADYVWMYDDGWGGSPSRTYNTSCTSAGSTACWAHRDELLGYDPRFNPGVGLYCRTCEMGTGFAIFQGSSSFVDLIELPAGRPPAMTFTWAANVLPYLETQMRSHPHPVKRHGRHHHSHYAMSRASARAAARRAERSVELAKWPTSGLPTQLVCRVPRARHASRPLACRQTTFTVRQVAVTTTREER